MVTIKEVYKQIEQHKITHDEKVWGNKLVARFSFNSTVHHSKIDHFVFTEWALDQLRTKLGISRYTFDKCRNSTPQIFENIMKTYLGVYRKKLLLRCGTQNGQKLRAVLSKDYSRYSNQEMMDMIQAKTPGQLLIQEAYVDDMIFSLRLLLQEFSIEQDKWRFGFRFFNSEVGKSRIWMDHLIYNISSACGLIISEFTGAQVSQIHYRIKEDRLKEKVESAYNLGNSSTAKVIERLKAEIHRKLDEDELTKLEEKLERALEKLQITVTEIKDIVKNKEKNYYHYAAAISEFAGGFTYDSTTNFERKQALEELAGKVMFWGSEKSQTDSP
jgi:hypothetical protein